MVDSWHRSRAIIEACGAAGAGVYSSGSVAWCSGVAAIFAFSLYFISIILTRGRHKLFVNTGQWTGDQPWHLRPCHGNCMTGSWHNVTQHDDNMTHDDRLPYQVSHGVRAPALCTLCNTPAEPVPRSWVLPGEDCHPGARSQLELTPLALVRLQRRVCCVSGAVAVAAGGRRPRCGNPSVVVRTPRRGADTI